jgi:hypothetical protein
MKTNKLNCRNGYLNIINKHEQTQLNLSYSGIVLTQADLYISV